MKHPESDLQTKVCKQLKRQYPGMIFFSDFAAGIKLEPFAANLRSIQACEGKYLDLTILEPSYTFSGLIIEIKCTSAELFLVDGSSLKSDHVQEQYNMIKRMRVKGYYADFGVGYDDIVGMIEDYIYIGGRKYKPVIERQTKIERELIEQDTFFKERGL